MKVQFVHNCNDDLKFCPQQVETTSNTGIDNLFYCGERKPIKTFNSATPRFRYLFET